MTYSDPKNDIAFKKLFGDKNHTDITINFLNAILERTGDDEISSLSIIDPANHPNNDGQKLSVVDVRCTDKNGVQYIVEMQVIDKDNFIERSQYYTALTLSNQLKKGMDYKKVRPVIFVGVVNFHIDSSPHYLNHHHILNTRTNQHILRHMEFHFLELPKFKKAESDLTTIADKWTYLLKKADRFKTIPSSLKSQSAILKALDVLNQHNWSYEEQLAYRKYMDAINSERYSRRAGIKTGLEKGIEIGVRKGREEGALAKAHQIAKSLLQLHDVATVVSITGLSENEVRALKSACAQGACKTTVV